MLEKLFNMNCLDYHRILTQKRIDLSLDATDLILLLEILDMYKSKGIFTDSMLKETSFEESELNEAMSNLLKHDYVELYFAKNENGKELEAYRFTPLFKALELIINNESISSSSNAKELEKLFAELEDGFKRKLSASELEKVSSWLEEKTFTEIMEAIDFYRGKATFKIANIEKKLFNYSKPKASDLIKEIMEN